MLSKLEQVILVVQDLESAADHYARLLGRRPSWRGEAEGTGVANLYFGLGSLQLHILSVACRGNYAGGVGEWLDARGEGLFGLVFETGDAQRCSRILRERGLETREPVEIFRDDATLGAPRHFHSIAIPPSATRGISVAVLENIEGKGGARIAESEFGVPAREAVASLDQVVVSSSDIESSRRLFEDGLGLRPSLGQGDSDRGSRALALEISGVTIEIVAGLEEPTRRVSSDRLKGLAWRVADLSAIRARLLRQGFEVSAESPGREPGTRVCEVSSDTHGSVTQLIQREDT